MPSRGGSPARGESLTARDKLRRRADFLRCYRKGRRAHGSLFVLHSVPNDLDKPRLGITVSRKVGGAVIRVRIKRRIREIYRRWRERSRLPCVDLVFHVKAGAAGASFGELREETERLLGGLIPRRRPGP